MIDKSGFGAYPNNVINIKNAKTEKSSEVPAVTERRTHHALMMLEVLYTAFAKCIPELQNRLTPLEHSVYEHDGGIQYPVTADTVNSHRDRRHMPSK